MKNRTSRKSGFTLVEIMIVVAIIGLLAAIAIPNFVRARTTSQKNACINNLRQIDGAKQQWALENKQAAHCDRRSSTDVQPYLRARHARGQLPGSVRLMAATRSATCKRHRSAATYALRPRAPDNKRHKPMLYNMPEAESFRASFVDQRRRLVVPAARLASDLLTFRERLQHGNT